MSSQLSLSNVFTTFHLEVTLIYYILYFLSPFFLQRGLGPYSFILFAIICLVTLIYIWLVVPETKNKTFLEVCQMFAKRNNVEIKLADGDLPLKENIERLKDTEKVTTFWRKIRVFSGEEVFALGGMVMGWKCFKTACVFYLTLNIYAVFYLLFVCACC